MHAFLYIIYMYAYAFFIELDTESPFRALCDFRIIRLDVLANIYAFGYFKISGNNKDVIFARSFRDSIMYNAL